MTPAAYEAFLDALSELPPADAVHVLGTCRLNDVEQFREVLSMCERPEEAAALIAANPECVAYIRVCTPEPEVEELYAAVKSAPNADVATVAMQAASRDVYEAVAMWLAMDRITDPESLGRYYLQFSEELS
jgi:hypothetical protein